MTERRYAVLNISHETKERIDKLADELGGIERASHGAVVEYLLKRHEQLSSLDENYDTESLWNNTQEEN